MKRTIARLFRLTLSVKLLLGFLSCGILTVFIAQIALSNLKQLNEINDRIIDRDILLEDTADDMIDTLLAQERYGRRSLILKPGPFRKWEASFPLDRKKCRKTTLRTGLQPCENRLNQAADRWGEVPQSYLIVLTENLRF